ncbi:MAG: hypothetical protein ACLUIQ_11630 [Dialister invisus]
MRGLIHGDFRPANMIVDDPALCGGLEAARVGHILPADIGQFFRYRRFTAEIVRFRRPIRRQEATLPPDWRRMSRCGI